MITVVSANSCILTYPLGQRQTVDFRHIHVGQDQRAHACRSAGLPQAIPLPVVHPRSTRAPSPSSASSLRG